LSNSDISFLVELESIVAARLQDAGSESYTARLADAGIKRIAQKVGEEGVELALAGLTGDREEIIDETADLLFHTIVLLAKSDLQLSDVCDRLRNRHTGG
jgi:phosphoribosyl-ATP pyrophosphohydrolase/phosphoribosyl-AMP cyclohydrolase